MRVIGVLFCIRLPKFIQIAPPTATVWPFTDFQDGSRGGAILLPVSYFMLSLSSESKHLSANQSLSTYLDPRLRYYYFRFGKNVRHIGILLPVSILTISPYSACRCAFVHYAAEFRPYRSILSLTGLMLYRFLRWQPQRRNITSGFVFDDVTLFWRSTSINIPNFIDVP